MIRELLVVAFLVLVIPSYANEGDTENISNEDLIAIKEILNEKLELYIINIGRNDLGLVEVTMGEKNRRPNPESGPVFFLYKENSKWHLHNEMSEWYKK